MQIERRHERSSKSWLALQHLLRRRAPEGAVIGDDQGLTIAAHGVPDEDVDRIAAELVLSPESAVTRTAGVTLHLYAPSLGRAEQASLGQAVRRIFETT